MGLNILGIQIFGRPSGYSQPGGYKTGYWLVEMKNGAAAIFGKHNLPKPESGRQFYWLGGNVQQANDRLPGAIGALNLDVSTYPQNVAGAERRPIGIAGDWNAPGAGGPKPLTPPSSKAPPTVPGANYPGSSPFGLNFGAVTDFLNYAAWLLHPLNWLRLAEFIVGLMLSAYGITLLARRGGASRNPVTGMARRVVSITPAGREIRTLQGRRMGRHEGQREAARMEARQRETRQVRTQSAYERERTNRSARQAARDE